MTVTTTATPGAGGGLTPAVDMVTATIDGFEVTVPKGTLLIRAAELLGIQVPRFCDHPLLDPVGACRQCLVEITDAGNGRGMPKPQASCTIPVENGMVVKTQLTSPVADEAQRGIMEFLLINHPLDCPVCDKGGECPLQNQAMSNGREESRFVDVKRTFPKPINISAQVLLDRERCVLCARCTRFSAQIAGDPFIEFLERGALQQVGIYERHPFESYYSGNTIQICPVGALTSAKYRFRARPFDLISTPTTCEHCASGCSLRTDHRRGAVLRRMAGDDPEVNEEWNCDKGRWAFHYATRPDRITSPMVRNADGELVAVPWTQALDVVARGLRGAQGRAGVLVGGRLPVEDAYAYAKFARVVLGTNDVDFRARPHSAEEADFLAAEVAGRGVGVTYRDLENATTVLLAGFEPEEESPIILLRLRKAVRKHGAAIFSVAPYASRSVDKTSGTLLMTTPGDEPRVLRALGAPPSDSNDVPGWGAHFARAAAGLKLGGAVILVGERLAAIPGALTSAAQLARDTGARLAWVPRRAGERGAIEAGALPGLLPGGRSVNDPSARAALEQAWGAPVPTTPGRSTDEMLAAAAHGDLAALVIGGVELDDLTDPLAARTALEAVPFLVSLEMRTSSVTELADVVLPVCAPAEKAGTFLDWEGRERPFDAVLRTPLLMPDGRVLQQVADAMDVSLGLPQNAAARRELLLLGRATSTTALLGTGEAASGGPASGGPASGGPASGGPASGAAAAAGPGQAVLATWRMLLDRGRMQDGEPFLAGTQRLPVVRLSPATAAEIGAAPGADVTVTSDRGSVRLPLQITDMPDRVVWLPTNSPGSAVRPVLAALPGDVVRIAVQPVGAQPTVDDPHATTGVPQ